MTRNALSSTAAAPAARNLKLENALLTARSKALELFQVLESKGDPLLMDWQCKEASEACWHVNAARDWCLQQDPCVLGLQKVHACDTIYHRAPSLCTTRLCAALQEA